MFYVLVLFNNLVLQWFSYSPAGDNTYTINLPYTYKTAIEIALRTNISTYTGGASNWAETGISNPTKSSISARFWRSGASKVYFLSIGY